MSIDNGGPAFPTGTQISQNNATGETTVCQYLSDGMSLRDYFAAKAMEARVIAYPTMAESDVAEYSYRMADAMLKARNK